jgi:hypothetical protein
VAVFGPCRTDFDLLTHPHSNNRPLKTREENVKDDKNHGENFLLNAAGCRSMSNRPNCTRFAVRRRWMVPMQLGCTRLTVYDFRPITQHLLPFAPVNSSPTVFLHAASLFSMFSTHRDQTYQETSSQRSWLSCTRQRKHA